DEGESERVRSLLNAIGEASASLPSRRLETEVSRLTREIGRRSWHPAARREAAPSLFRREGDSWHIEFEGRTLRLKDTLGLQYLSRLLGRPGQEVHALDLVSQSNLNTAEAQPAHETDIAHWPPSAESVIDSAARNAYKTRLEELEAEIDEAELWNDPERVARASEEKDFLLRELAGAFGIGGAPRRITDAGERARQSATKAVKAAIVRISRDHKELGQHLRATVRTGAYFSYTPDPRLTLTWRFD
ncbi:MAG TPA: hypothetical protein VFZ12_08385, partial [Dehalococcoidia bacterium]|nr:hypothetical protein [Dehalococcoidia bacterium]